MHENFLQSRLDWNWPQAKIIVFVLSQSVGDEQKSGRGLKHEEVPLFIVGTKTSYNWI